MNDSHNPVKKDRVDNDVRGPADERQESEYYYDDSTGYEVYEDDTDESTTEKDGEPGS